MRAFSTAVIAKLGKLIPRLATDHDGEVVATVRAIARTLSSAGLDWHDLTKAVTRDPEAVVVDRDRKPESWWEIAAWCRDNDRGRLNPKERQFVNDMCGRLIHGGEPTERQGSWLRAIYSRLGAGS